MILFRCPSLGFYVMQISDYSRDVTVYRAVYMRGQGENMAIIADFDFATIAILWALRKALK
jgi:hypothetical protein